MIKINLELNGDVEIAFFDACAEIMKKENSPDILKSFLLSKAFGADIKREYRGGPCPKCGEYHLPYDNPHDALIMKLKDFPPEIRDKLRQDLDNISKTIREALKGKTENDEPDQEIAETETETETEETGNGE